MIFPVANDTFKNVICFYIQFFSLLFYALEIYSRTPYITNNHLHIDEIQKLINTI